MKSNKRTHNDLQNITRKTKDRATRTPLKTGCPCSGRVLVSPIVLLHLQTRW